MGELSGSGDSVISILCSRGQKCLPNSLLTFGTNEVNGRYNHVFTGGLHNPANNQQCSFDISLTHQAVFLFDRSNDGSTQVSGENATPFTDGRLPRRTILLPTVNTRIQWGLDADNLSVFEVVWHYDDRQVREIISSMLPCPKRPIPKGLKDEEDFEDEVDSTLRHWSASSAELMLKRKRKLQKLLEASKPAKQFEIQIDEQIRRIEKTRKDPSAGEIRKIAEETIRKKWIRHNIWHPDWTERPYGNWQHEMPHTPSRRACCVSQSFQGASRPFPQFLVQLREEYERLHGEGSSGDPCVPQGSSEAYENVKRTWVIRGLWDNNWGFLPGHAWKHERPLEESLAEAVGKHAFLHPLGLDEILVARRASATQYSRSLFGLGEPSEPIESQYSLMLYPAGGFSASETTSNTSETGKVDESHEPRASYVPFDPVSPVSPSATEVAEPFRVEAAREQFCSRNMGHPAQHSASKKAGRKADDSRKRKRSNAKEEDKTTEYNPVISDGEGDRRSIKRALRSAKKDVGEL